MTITYEEYVAARAALVIERARVLPGGLDALREWLAAGADERKRQQRVEEKARRRAEPTTTAKASEPAKGGTRIPPTLEKSRPGGAPRPAPPRAPALPRSFSPSGPTWRP
jgi:hypothetical protein